MYFEFRKALEGNECKVFTAPFDVILPNEKMVTSVVQPDLCIVCDPSKLGTKGCNGAPDLIVEILSPGNSKKEMKDKFDIYEAAGVNEYWLVHPSERTVIVYALDASGKFVSHRPFAEDMTIDSVSIKGLSINLNFVFPN